MSLTVPVVTLSPAAAELVDELGMQQEVLHAHSRDPGRTCPRRQRRGAYSAQTINRAGCPSAPPPRTPPWNEMISTRRPGGARRPACGLCGRDSSAGSPWVLTSSWSTSSSGAAQRDRRATAASPRRLPKRDAIASGELAPRCLVRPTRTRRTDRQPRVVQQGKSPIGRQADVGLQPFDRVASAALNAAREESGPPAARDDARTAQADRTRGRHCPAAPRLCCQRVISLSTFGHASTGYCPLGTDSALGGTVRSMVAVITGATSGIGRELARVFKAEGFEVVGFGEEDFDLATPEGVQAPHCQHRPSNQNQILAALNAGISVSEELAENDLDKRLSCRSTSTFAASCTWPSSSSPTWSRGEVNACLHVLDRGRDAGPLPGHLQRFEVIRFNPSRSRCATSSRTAA